MNEWEIMGEKEGEGWRRIEGKGIVKRMVEDY